MAFPCCPGCPHPRVHGITALQYSRPTVGGAARPSPCSAPRKKEAGLPRGCPWLSRWPALIAPPRGHPATLSLQSHPHHCHHPADGKTAAPDAPRHGPAGCTPRAQAGGAPTPASECSRRGRGAQVTGAACRPNARPGRQLLTSPFRAGGRWGTPSSRRDRAHICCLPSAPVLPVAGKTGRWPAVGAGWTPDCAVRGHTRHWRKCFCSRGSEGTSRPRFPGSGGRRDSPVSLPMLRATGGHAGRGERKRLHHLPHGARAQREDGHASPAPGLLPSITRLSINGERQKHRLLLGVSNCPDDAWNL